VAGDKLLRVKRWVCAACKGIWFAPVNGACPSCKGPIAEKDVVYNEAGVAREAD
jgi:hypothetical protein